MVAKKKETEQKKVDTPKASGGQNKYELAIVLAGGSTTAKKKSTQETVEKIVKVSGGKVDEVNDWGDKKLAYKIEGNATGAFLIFSLELSGSAATNLSEKLRHEDDVIRYLLVKSDK